MPLDGVTYTLYGDPAYPQSVLLFGGFWRPGAGTIEPLWNRLMSKVREVVEWGFNQIVSNWRFLDLRASMKIFKVPITKYYIIGGFLANIRTTLYDNQINVYFQCETLSLKEYLELVD